MSLKARQTLLAFLLLYAVAGRAQELEPRAYSPAPVGVNFFLLAAVRSSGEVLLDPSVPIENLEAKINIGVAGYGRTFGFFGHQASAAIVLPFANGDFSGDIGENRESVTRSGVGDLKLRFATNLIGGEALTPAEFMKRNPRTTLGASLTLSAPTGQYDPAKLVNIGTNRWALKSELGLTIPHGPWMFDAFAGVWFFTDNPEFFGGVRREQDPIGTLQAHASYTFRPRLWLAVDGTHYFGGQSTVGGVDKNDRQENARVGVTLSVPATPKHSLKFTWSKGASTRLGSNFTSYGVAWQYTWFDKPKP